MAIVNILVLNIRILVFGIDVGVVVDFRLRDHKYALDVVCREIEILRILSEVVRVVGLLSAHIPVTCPSFRKSEDVEDASGLTP